MQNTQRLARVLPIALALLCGTAQLSAQNDDYQLVWADEFDTDGRPDTANWNFEHGFVRNEELQWYQPQNAECRDGVLVITAKAENRPSPMFREGARDWRHTRRRIEYTSSCLTSKREFLYGRLEVRARIPAASGSWPAIWTLGRTFPWPSGGEIDIMEYYHIKGVPHILANVACGTDQPNKAKWHTVATPYTHFSEKDAYWSEQFHVWRMDWDEHAIRLFLDGELLNETLLADTQNGRIGRHENPFRTPQYILLNLAVGGLNGGEVDQSALPFRYEVDYVRIYQKK